MLTAILLGLAMALVIEGLVLALAPSRLDEMLAQLAEIPVETRRTIGLVCIGLGVAGVAVIQAIFG